MSHLTESSSQSGACPLLHKIPLEIRLQIWEHVAEKTERFGHFWSSCGSFAQNEPKSNQSPTHHWRGILTANRQIHQEISPHFYERVCVTVPHSNQVLRWVQTISPRNSACIRHLVIQYHLLLLRYHEQNRVDERELAWTAALRCMPNLLSLTFDFNESHREITRRAIPDANSFVNDTILLFELAKSALAWSKIQGLTTTQRTIDFQYYPQRNPPDPYEGQGEVADRRFNHAVIAIDEEVPFPLQRFFAKHLETNYTYLDFPVTGLPPSFFHTQGLELINTFALNKDQMSRVSVVLTYQKGPRRQVCTTSQDLNFVLTGLPIKYLRLGCRYIDSKDLYQIPNLIEDLVSLDLAFTDPDPTEVVMYLNHIQARCPKLYTLAIAVSPLHDRDPDDPKPEKFFNRKSVSAEMAATWKPFWDKMDEMNAGGTRVWEGEVRYQLVRGLNSGIRLSSPRSPSIR